MMGTRKHDEADSGSRRSDWTKQVDLFLARVRGMPAPEAAARYGLGKEAILSWRRKRERGEPVTGLRAKYQEALVRALDLDVRASTIPILGPVKFRRTPARSPAPTRRRKAPASAGD